MMASLTGTKDDPIECSVHTLPKPLIREFLHVFGEKYHEDLMMMDNNVIQQPPLLQSQHKDDDDEDMKIDDDNTGEQQQNKELLAIPTNQQAREDLVAVGEEIEYEKDRLLNVFLDFGKDLCEKLRNQYGYWADYIDPCSGLPMMTRDCNKVYSEVDGMECLLNYRAYNAGFCKVLTHPKWGTAVYPATIFCYAPRDVVIRLVQEYQLMS